MIKKYNHWWEDPDWGKKPENIKKAQRTLAVIGIAVFIIGVSGLLLIICARLLR